MPIIPEDALAVLRIVRATGKRPRTYQGGRRYFNANGVLPADQAYREYDVDPKAERGRSGRRVVVGELNGRAWYTSDHYLTFQPISEDDA